MVAHAAAGPWQGGQELQLRLISASTHHNLASDGHQLNVALEAKLAKGWKIYWRSPGDAGLPLSLILRLVRRYPGIRYYFLPLNGLICSGLILLVMGNM